MQAVYGESMEVKQIAKRLNIPAEIVQHILTENWEQVYGFFKYKWNQDGYVAWKKNQKAVERIIEVFYELTKGKFHADDTIKKAIGLYVERLGVKILIDDMKVAITKTPQIRTLNYFLRTQKGEKMSRWGNIYLDQVEAEIKAKAEKEKEISAEVAQTELGQLLRNSIKKVDEVVEDDPDWLKKDKARLKELEVISNDKITVRERGERVFLRMKIENINKGNWKAK